MSVCEFARIHQIKLWLTLIFQSKVCYSVRNRQQSLQNRKCNIQFKYCQFLLQSNHIFLQNAFEIELIFIHHSLKTFTIKLSILGSGHLQVNSIGLNLKVYVKSLKELDLNLVVMIEMPHPPPIKLF